MYYSYSHPSFICIENTILVLCSAYFPASFWYSTYIPIVFMKTDQNVVMDDEDLV